MKAARDPLSEGQHRSVPSRPVRLLIVMALASLLGLAVAAPVLARLVGGAQAALPPPVAAPMPSVAPQRDALAHLPMRFVANQGQWQAAVRFAAPGAGHTLYFTPRQVIFSLAGEGGAAATRVRLSFPGARAHPQMEGMAPLPGSVNFFLGNDATRWRVNVPSHGAIVYRNLYPGVDLVYSGLYGQIKGEFHLAPGVHPRRIQLAYWGVRAAEVLPDGALRLRTARGALVEAAPWAYQEVDGAQRAVTARYQVLLAPPRTPFPIMYLPVLVRFEVRGYDPRWPLVIDPVLRYASFMGGSKDESGYGIAVDSAGNIYVAGSTTSSDFPTHVAIQRQRRDGSDAFVTQLLRVGEVYTYGFSTYLGGGGSDIAYGIAVDDTGSAVTIVGETNSGDFPTFNAPQATKGVGSDAFVTRLITQSGAITFAYSTYLGGRAVDRALAVALDGAGDAVVVGETTSSNFFTTSTAIQPTCGGAPGPCSWDAFVTRIANSGGYTFTYSSYLGGSGTDRALSVAVDTADDSIFVTGETNSTNFPTFNAPQATKGVGSDAFVTRLITQSGAVTFAYSTYLGGTFADAGRGIAVDGNGNAWVTGNTGSADFPHNADAVQPTCGNASNGVGGDAFLTHIVDAGGVYTFAYSTFLGGSQDDVAYGLTLDSSEDPVIVGQTFSRNFPRRYALQGSLRGASDAFVTQLISTTGAYTLGLSTYLGGSGNDAAYGVAVDAAGDIYVTGQTYSGDFPTVQALDASRSGATDAFVARIGWGGLMISKTATPTLVAPGQTVTYTLVFTNDSPTLAQNVVISDYLPIPITFSDASYVSSGAAVTPTGSFSYTWQVADLAQGAGGTIQVLAVLSSGLTPGDRITNTAAITGDGAYSNAAYNISSVVITVGHGVYLPIISKQP